MNISNPTSFSPPDLTLTTSNSSGTAGALRADDSILVYDTTVPTTIASAASAATGSAATAARRDHTHGMYTATAAATQAEMETASSTTTYASPGRTKYHPGVAKVWVNFQGTGTAAIRESYNMTSITDVGTGNYTVTFDVDFATTGYAAVCGKEDGTNEALGSGRIAIHAQAVGLCGCLTYRDDATTGVPDSADAADVMIAIFGDQ
jgi:mannose-6-phosphate isomerase-like protein (cupin superfamily)